MNDTVVVNGGEIKSLGSRRIGGYAVLFTGPNDADQQGEFFTRHTDFYLDDGTSRRRLLWDHGRDSKLRTRKLADAVLHVAEKGVWCEAELRRMDAVEEHVLALTNKGRLGFSTGSAGHLVERARAGNAVEIKSWPISEVSVTTSPCESRCRVQALKSLVVAPFAPNTYEQRALEIMTRHALNMLPEIERSQHDDDRSEMEKYYSALAAIKIRRFEQLRKGNRE